MEESAVVLVARVALVTVVVLVIMVLEVANGGKCSSPDS